MNDNIQGILSKARGYVARLSMVLFVLEQSLESVLEGGNPEAPCTWSTTITEDCVKASAQIMDYLIKQKLIMMDASEVGPSDTTTPGQMAHVEEGDRLRRLLTLMTDDEAGHISPSKVAQKHICAPIDGKYSVSKAMDLFSVATNLGFGETIEQTTSTNRRVKKFRKTPYDILSAEARKTLRHIRVTEDMYRSSFKLPSSDDSLVE